MTFRSRSAATAAREATAEKAEEAVNAETATAEKADAETTDRAALKITAAADARRIITKTTARPRQQTRIPQRPKKEATHNVNA